MKEGRIRAIVICVFSRNDTILLSEGFDEVKQEYYYLPIGGGIEFGETSKEALIREVKEEINAKVDHIKYLGTTCKHLCIQWDAWT
ncbi:NUDIX domain-containing protein [Niallia circulans]|uniref:NUDIX domain-containing protein n=1 Tax=Niallia circulans TaxID=1397 RepID=UPI001F21DAD9|nr:NUDIX domain-containing protein [Niallia circulans]